MQKRCSALLGFVLWTSFFTVLFYPSVAQAETCEKPVAKVVSVQGTVESQRVGATQWQAVTLNDAFCPGDKIRVQERSRADLALLDQSVLRPTKFIPPSHNLSSFSFYSGTRGSGEVGPQSLESAGPFSDSALFLTIHERP